MKVRSVGTQDHAPFGNLYEIPIYIDARVAEHKEITFNAGTHRELMRMAWRDLERLIDPQIMNLTHWPVGVA